MHFDLERTKGSLSSRYKSKVIRNRPSITDCDNDSSTDFSENPLIPKIHEKISKLDISTFKSSWKDGEKNFTSHESALQSKRLKYTKHQVEDEHNFLDTASKEKVHVQDTSCKLLTIKVTADGNCYNRKSILGQNALCKKVTPKDASVFPSNGTSEEEDYAVNLRCYDIILLLVSTVFTLSN